MLVYVDIPRNYKKPKVKLFKWNCINRNRKVAEFLLKLQEEKKQFEVYKRDRQDNKYDIAVHIH